MRPSLRRPLQVGIIIELGHAEVNKFTDAKNFLLARLPGTVAPFTAGRM